MDRYQLILQETVCWNAIVTSIQKDLRKQRAHKCWV